MKSIKLFSILTLTLLLLVNFSSLSFAQDKKQDVKEKTSALKKVDVKKIEKPAEKASKCTRHLKKDNAANNLKGKVLIPKDHDCSNCLEGADEHGTECEHIKTKCEHEAEKKVEKPKKEKK